MEQQQQLELEVEAFDLDRPWYFPHATNPVDAALEQIIADPSTRFAAWCAAQEIRERRRQAVQS